MTFLRERQSGDCSHMIDKKTKVKGICTRSHSKWETHVSDIDTLILSLILKE